MRIQVLLWMFLGGTVQWSMSWDVDPRCPPPPNRRFLGVEEEDSWVSDKNAPMRANGITWPKALNTLRGNVGQTTDFKSRSRTLVSSLVFRLKMHWEEGYCWQEEYSRHRKWCWECKQGCKENGTLWWQTCAEKDEQQFIYLADSNGGRFQTAHSTLCLQRVSVTQFALKRCSRHKAQVFRRLGADGQPFELSPLGNSSLCINQAHHPKAGEIVEATTCKASRHWHTNLMEQYHAIEPTTDGQLQLRASVCSRQDPCNHCQGDCNGDDQCLGADLVCFQRRGITKDSRVPGCKGIAATDRDYCVKRDGTGSSSQSSAPPPISPNNQIPLEATHRNCSKTQPCNRCEGDCDLDADCMPGLKCFQKDGPVTIPGCVGRDGSKTDFCYLP